MDKKEFITKLLDDFTNYPETYSVDLQKTRVLKNGLSFSWHVKQGKIRVFVEGDNSFGCLTFRNRDYVGVQSIIELFKVLFEIEYNKRALNKLNKAADLLFRK